MPDNTFLTLSWCSLSCLAGYIGADQLGAALKGCEVVVIPAGVPRKPGGYIFTSTLFIFLSAFIVHMEWHLQPVSFV